jgi:predicted O-methyltransferase YrrM
MTVFTRVKQILFPIPAHRETISVEFTTRHRGWLTENLGPAVAPPAFPECQLIEQLALKTEELGAKPLWRGYENVPNYPRETANTERSSNQVRSTARAGRFFTWLAIKRRADLIVEFGTAFGISGMYWLAGLKKRGHGRLLTFEPNSIWAEIARENLSRISNRFDLTVGTFEGNIDARLKRGDRIDLAFVDAIHTGDFVRRQFEILAPRMQAGGLILFDDVNFSADMTACWQTLARDRRVHASATLDGRLGIAELAPVQSNLTGGNL